MQQIDLTVETEYEETWEFSGEGSDMSSADILMEVRGTYGHTSAAFSISSDAPTVNGSSITVDPVDTNKVYLLITPEETESLSAISKTQKYLWDVRVEYIDGNVKNYFVGSEFYLHPKAARKAP